MLHRHRRPRRPVSRTLSLREAATLHQLTLEAENRTLNARMRYRLLIERFTEYMDDDKSLSLSALTIENARGFIRWLRVRPSVDKLTGATRKLSAMSVREYASALKSFANFCVREELLPVDPLARLSLPTAVSRVVDPFTQDEVRAMLLAIESGPFAQRNRAIIYMLLSTGMRASELCALKVSDVDLSGKRAKLLGKGSKERYAYFDRPTQRQLALTNTNHHIVGVNTMVHSANGVTHVPLFTTKSGRPFTYRALYGLVHDWGEVAGIQDAHPHRFRHTFAVAFLRAHPGALFHLQQLLGHTQLEMTRRYAKLAETETPLDGPSPLEQMGIR